MTYWVIEMFADEIFAFQDADLIFGGAIVVLYLAILYVQRSFNKKI